MKSSRIGILTGLAALALLPIASAEAMPQKKSDVNQLSLAQQAPNSLPTVRVLDQTFVATSPTATVTNQVITKKAQVTKYTLSTAKSNQQVQTIVNNQVLLSGQTRAVYQK